MRKVALKPGSSKQGKAFRADSGSNWVAARALWKYTSITYINTTLEENMSTFIHSLHPRSLAVKAIQVRAPSVPCASVFIGVRAVVETIVGIWEVGSVIQCQKTALAYLDVSGELNSYLLVRLVLQYSHILGLAITQLGKRKSSNNPPIIWSDKSKYWLTSWNKTIQVFHETLCNPTLNVALEIFISALWSTIRLVLCRTNMLITMRPVKVILLMSGLRVRS